MIGPLNQKVFMEGTSEGSGEGSMVVDCLFQCINSLEVIDNSFVMLFYMCACIDGFVCVIRNNPVAPHLGSPLYSPFVAKPANSSIADSHLLLAVLVLKYCMVCLMLSIYRYRNEVERIKVMNIPP